MRISIPMFGEGANDINPDKLLGLLPCQRCLALLEANFVDGPLSGVFTSNEAVKFAGRIPHYERRPERRHS